MPSLSRARRYFRSPKGIVTIVLAILTAVAAPAEGIALVLPELSAAIAAAVVTDALLLRLRRPRWTYPDGALLTGWIIGLILSPHERWWVAVVASMIAIAAKHAFRGRTANVFNPAALALVTVYYLFDAAQSWWGALPDAPAPALGALVATGLFVTDRVNKLPLVLSFLGAWFAFATIGAFADSPSTFAELYRAPDAHAALFFAFFMATDPPTSPPRQRDQVAYGGIAAASAFAVFRWVGAVHFLLSGLLVANVWEAWRRRAQWRAAARKFVAGSAA